MLYANQRFTNTCAITSPRRHEDTMCRTRSVIAMQRRIGLGGKINIPELPYLFRWMSMVDQSGPEVQEVLVSCPKLLACCHRGIIRDKELALRILENTEDEPHSWAPFSYDLRQDDDVRWLGYQHGFPTPIELEEYLLKKFVQC